MFHFDLADADVDVVSDLLWGLHVAGIEEIRLDDDTVRLRSSLGLGEAETLRVLTSVLPAWAPTISIVDDATIDTWRDYVDPIDISPILRILPAWKTAGVTPLVSPNTTPHSRYEVIIDPGATFGMGDHPTTRACLMMLASRSVTGASVLDVGCGSGILGVTALVMGASRAHGVDVHPASPAVSSSNAKLNGVDEKWSVTLEPLTALSGRSDLVFANILPATLIDLSSDLRRLLAENGTLILAGLPSVASQRVLESMHPLLEIDRIVIDDWVTVALQSTRASTSSE